MLLIVMLFISELTFNHFKLTNIFACGENFIKFIKKSISSLRQFKTVSFCSCFVEDVTHSSLIKNANQDF